MGGLLIGRFFKYLDKVFCFNQVLCWLTDSRLRPQIPLKSIWLSVFLMFVMRLRSLNGVEGELRMPGRFDGLIGSQKPSADTLGRVFSLMDTESLRQILVRINYRLKRNKVFSGVSGLFFVAIDGHEFFKSKHRHCHQCSWRVHHNKETNQDVVEYYHRGVVCHLISQNLAIPLDIEMIQTWEAETTAAQRLIERVCKLYPRFFDVIVGDALYISAPFFNFCQKQGKHVIAVLKGNRELLTQAHESFSHQKPFIYQEKNKVIRYWDHDEFTCYEGLKEPLRVLHTEETITKRQRIEGKWIEKIQTSNWWWATTLPIAKLPSKNLWEIAHHRWDIENCLFNTLSTHWQLDHCFKHHPKAIINFNLTLFIAFVLIQSFYLRNMKLQRRKHLTLIALAGQLYLALAELQKQSRSWIYQSSKPP